MMMQFNRVSPMSILSSLFLATLLICAFPVLALDFSDLAAEGEIKYLKVRPDPGAYSYESRVKITAASLKVVALKLQHAIINSTPFAKSSLFLTPTAFKQLP
jgi:hypothetical protein